MEKKYIMAIDQGTTNTKVDLFDHDGMLVTRASLGIRQIYRNPGWVEHDPMEYYETVVSCAKKVMADKNIAPGEIAAIGITCQRETTVMWDKNTGEPVENGICWQCRRSAPICDRLRKTGLEQKIREKTGLFLDAYFSGTKIMWILENVPGVRERAERGDILFGTIDSWLMWKLSGGRCHVTDYTNASRTLLFNIHTLGWDAEMCALMGIPMQILPELKPCSGDIALTERSVFGAEIGIHGVMGDQQSATFGQACFEKGQAKNTYGTSLAIMMNIGETPVLSNNGMITDLLYADGKNKTTYAFEYVANIGGEVIRWLRDEMKLIETAAGSMEAAARVADTQGVYLVPAFTGLNAPYWDSYARGLIIGITRGTTSDHIVRAGLESICYQTRDGIEAMMRDSGAALAELKVDGGATVNPMLMQMQADILGIPIVLPATEDMAALGCAYAAGLAVGFWKDRNEIQRLWNVKRRYEPQMERSRADEMYGGWKRAVQRSLSWAEA